MIPQCSGQLRFVAARYNSNSDNLQYQPLRTASPTPQYGRENSSNCALFPSVVDIELDPRTARLNPRPRSSIVSSIHTQGPSLPHPARKLTQSSPHTHSALPSQLGIRLILAFPTYRQRSTEDVPVQERAFPQSPAGKGYPDQESKTK